MKFAYLIMIHTNSRVLHYLLRQIDDVRNDIYIHVDAKVNLDFENELRQLIKESNIYFIKERISVYWAHISQVKAEYALFQDAYKQKYTYYHLLSGSDLPIKSQDYIHSFFTNNYGKEFIGFDKNSSPDRVKYIYLFAKYFRSKFFLFKRLRDMFIKVQKVFNANNFSGNEKGIEIKKGANWVSVTHEFVGLMLEEKDFILKLMKYAKSPDEHYKQTLAFNSFFKKNIYSYDDEYKGCMRLTDWERGNPYNWRDSDFDEIVSSDRLFARKFDEKSFQLLNRLVTFNGGEPV